VTFYFMSGYVKVANVLACLCFAVFCSGERGFGGV
jgi:hypothetical protein